MSMLTAQANHLRETAYTVERIKNDAVGKLPLSGSIALAMAAMDMRDAADTIAQLRNTCNDLQAENAKLRDIVTGYLPYHIDTSCGECEIRDECHEYQSQGPWMGCLYQVRLRERAKALGIEVER